MKMKRRKVLLVAFLIVAVVLGWLVWRPAPPVIVIVKNDSQQRIATLRVEKERGVELAGNLASGETKTIQFQAGGENSFTLQVRFADGSEISGNPQYVEPGYEVLETVSDSEITITDVRLPSGY
jgi:hypothetical protein